MADQEDDKTVWIVCSPIGNRPKFDFIDGSTPLVCEKCGTPVMISPATLQVKKEKDGHAICIPCAAPQLNTPDSEVARTGVQNDELVREMRKRYGFTEEQAKEAINDLFKKLGGSITL